MTASPTSNTQVEADSSPEPRIIERPTKGQEQLASISSPLLRRIYAGRGIREENELDYRLSGLPHFSGLKGVDDAVRLLVAAINEQRPIRIVGDFDADGATSTALSLIVLKKFGAQVDFFMPRRAVHGYGLSPAVVEALSADAGQGGLILTVDNGIASIDGVHAAHEAGWQVVVTDHHLPGNELPQADAIVNPNQPGCDFPARHLAGVGVVFYVMSALRSAMAASGWEDLPKMATLLDLVAIGTIADVVPLDHVNRTLVSQGLRRIRADRSRPGVMALVRSAGRDYQRLGSTDVGFAVAPRLNAAGRLDDMRLGVLCLCADDPIVAGNSADTLSNINRQRRQMQQRMQQEAEAMVANYTVDDKAKDAWVVYESDWHEGIVGLVASKLRERMQRPVVAFAPGAGELLKGSARSIPGLHIRDVLAGVDAKHPGLIVRFGGHAQAAGLTLSPEALGNFAVQFEQEVARHLTPAMCQPGLLTDGILGAAEHDLATAELLQQGGPWGAGFETPVFHGTYQVLSQRIVGQNHLKLLLQPIVGGAPVAAMYFNYSQWLDEALPQQLVFQLRVDDYGGRYQPSLVVSHCQPA